jgi:hypothetical protein
MTLHDTGNSMYKILVSVQFLLLTICIASKVQVATIYKLSSPDKSTVSEIKADQNKQLVYACYIRSSGYSMVGL